MVIKIKWLMKCPIVAGVALINCPPYRTLEISQFNLIAIVDVPLLTPRIYTHISSVDKSGAVVN